MQFPIIVLLLVLGCTKLPTSDWVDAPTEDTIGHIQPGYKSLTKLPDNVLDRMRSTYPKDFQGFHTGWTEQASALPLDGQRAIELLEIACYADAMCHTIEYPLRVATLDYIEANLEKADVAAAVQWISHSYISHLPLNAPNDEAGQFHGLLVESMNLRMVDYAEELLNPKVPSQHRK